VSPWVYVPVPAPAACPCAPSSPCPCSYPLLPVPIPPPCHAPGCRWKALSKAEKSKYIGSLMPPRSSPPGGYHARPPASAPCLSPAPTTTVGVVPDQIPSATRCVRPPAKMPAGFVWVSRRVRPPVMAVAAPARMPAGFVWVSTLAEQRNDLSRGAPAQQSSTDSETESYSSEYSTYAAAPTALPAAPPPLPAGLAHTLNDKLNGLDGALAAPPVPLMAEPTVSSSSWLEQQELASVLENQLTGVEAIEVSKTL
jgi:hypothetical protein